MAARKYSCEICCVRSIGQVDYEAHIRGIKHRFEVKRLIQQERNHCREDKAPPAAQYTCMMCEEATYDSALSYQDHLLSKHPKPISEAAQANAAGSGKSFIPIKCGFCDGFLANHHHYEGHVTGKQHMCKVKQEIQNERHWASIGNRPPQPVRYECLLCCTTYEGPGSYYEHLLSKHPSHHLVDTTPYLATTGSEKPPFFIPVKCTFCNAFLANRHNYEGHITGKQHRREIQQMVQNAKHLTSIGRPPQPVSYQCLLCCTSYKGPEKYLYHLTSKHPSRHSVNTAPRHSVDTAPRHSVDTAPRHSVDTAPRHSVDTAPYLGRTLKAITMRHGSSGIVCQVCRIVFPQKNEYWEHKRSAYHLTAVRYLQQREKHSYENSRIQEEFRRRENATNYASSSQWKSGYKCSLCGAFHRSQYLLDTHIFSQHPEMTNSDTRH